MALTGHLSDLSLSELIEFFCNQRKTGQLKVLYPQGDGVFHIQTGSVVDARIGVLRGIEAVYFALTLPNARFEFGASSEPTERTINQPWTQVVLEGLRRLDEGLVPPPAFPPDYQEDVAPPESTQPDAAFTELEDLRVPAFLSFNKEPMGKRRFLVTGAVAVVVLGSVAAIGVPAGWYGRTQTSSAASQSSVPPVAPTSNELMSATEAAGVWKDEAPAPAEPIVQSTDTTLAAKRSYEMQKTKAREERTAATTPLNQPAETPTAPQPKTVVADTEKPGAKKVTVSVTYDESGRVTQASGGDASAVRIARQKRFPAGKAGSATITIPIN
jgi:hypothetical protein